MVNEATIKEIMEIYADITRNTIICMDMNNLLLPIFFIGLDISSLIEYADFKEVLSFLKKQGKQNVNTSDNSNIFYTFITNNLFAYNIVILNDVEENLITLIAGPILSYLPNNESLNRIIVNNKLPYYKRNKFIEILNNLPLATFDRITQLGKLLLSLSKMDSDSWSGSRQDLKGRESKEKPQQGYLGKSFHDSQEVNELHEMYKFGALMMDKIIHGDVNGIMDIVSEYENLFLGLESFADNNRSLKNRCIIIISIACHYAIQSNVPYERMINNLWRSILELEKLRASKDIIVQMAASMEGFAHAVLALSDSGYSLYIRRVFNYIKGHLSEKITLGKLADFVQISPGYLSSLLKIETHQSLSDHINRYRITESKRLLMYTNKSIQEIAYDVGYNYQNHYNAVFKKLEGQTPLEFRRNTGSKNYVEHNL
jgi:AraC-like DNA-binding protein